MSCVQSDTQISEGQQHSPVQDTPESPDCNPIENLWHELKHFMWTTVKPHKEELIQGMGQQLQWRSVASHLQKVIPKVLVDGEATGY